MLPTSNSTGWGIEATGPIPAGAYGPGAFPQYHEYEAMVACILEAEGWGTGKVWAHKESCSPPGRKVDPYFDTGPFEQGVQQAMAGASPGEDDVPYKDWPAADKSAMMDDVARIIGEGKKPDGTVPGHLAERSTRRIREIQDLIRIGDTSGGETDTHDYSSVEGVGRQVKDLAEQVAAQGELLNQILAAITGGTPTPDEEGSPAHP